VRLALTRALLTAMAHGAFQPLRTSEPGLDEDDDFEPGDWDGAEDDSMMERLQPSRMRGATRQVMPLSYLGNLSLSVLRNGKVAGPVTLALGAVLVLSLLASFGPSQQVTGLRAARARTQDSVEKDGMMQDKATMAPAPVPVQQAQQAQQVQQSGVSYAQQTTVKGGAVVTAQTTGTKTVHGDCHCCCVSCGCDEGSVAYCSSMTCPTGYMAREGSEHIECKGDACTLEADLSMCCNRRATCDEYSCQAGYSLKPNAEHILCEGSACGPEDNSLCCLRKATCDNYQCPAGHALVANAQNIMCSNGACSTSDCCEVIPGKDTVTTSEQQIIVTPKPTEIDIEVPPEEIMICDINCFNEGVDSVTVELPEDDVKDLASCREACKNNEDCHGVVYKKDFETTGDSTCHGKKDIHIAKCQPGGEYYTEIIKDRPWGICALLGDPHIIQFDRPSQMGKPAFDDYDQGDYILVQSKEITVHARFGFTERFPTATSTKGVAVQGSKIGGKALVAGYSEKQKKFIAWWDGKEILKEKGETFDDGILVAKYDDMDPTDFHTEARHTIGEHADKVASWTFEFKDVPLKIYMLLGPDNVNVVLEMQKLEYPMDGLCGNFNCDPDDEDEAALSSRGESAALEWQESNFQLSEGTFHEKVYAKGEAAEEVLQNCDPELLKSGRDACGFKQGSGVDEVNANACLVDVCMAGNVDVAQMDVETVEVEQEVDIDVESH